MAEQSKIEWTDHTFNPWEGCQKVAPECDHCYAESRDMRFTGGAHWGPKAPRRRTSTQNWNKPRRWNKQAEAFHAAHGRRQRVFCASLADVFDNAVDPTWREDLWALVRECDQLDWLLLTKRPQNIAKMLPPDWEGGWPHVWLGTSAGTQKTADQNIPHLLAVPAAVRFVSAEPLLGPVELTWLGHDGDGALDALRGESWGWPVSDMDTPQERRRRIAFEQHAKLDWVIAGGESGRGARPMHPDWARTMRDQCQAAGVAFFHKQNGAWQVTYDRDCDDPDWRRCDVVARETPTGRWLNLEGGHGFHGERVLRVVPVTKKAAGRTLDGREWNEVPCGLMERGI